MFKTVLNQRILIGNHLKNKYNLQLQCNVKGLYNIWIYENESLHTRSRMFLSFAEKGKGGRMNIFKTITCAKKKGKGRVISIFNAITKKLSIENNILKAASY